MPRFGKHRNHWFIAPPTASLTATVPERLVSTGIKTADGAVVIFNNGGFPRPEIESFRTPVEGLYRVKIHGYAYQTDKPVAVAVWHGCSTPAEVPRRLPLSPFPRSKKWDYFNELIVWLKRNARLAFLPELNGDNLKLRNVGPAKYPGAGLAIQSVEIEGPLFDEWPGRGHTLLFGDLPIREIGAANPISRKGKGNHPVFEIESKDFEADARQRL